MGKRLRKQTHLQSIKYTPKKCLGVNLIQEVKDLHPENYKMLMKKLKMQINGKTFHVYGLEE